MTLQNKIKLITLLAWNQFHKMLVFFVGRDVHRTKPRLITLKLFSHEIRSISTRKGFNLHITVWLFVYLLLHENLVTVVASSFHHSTNRSTFIKNPNLIIKLHQEQPLINPIITISLGVYWRSKGFQVVKRVWLTSTVQNDVKNSNLRWKSIIPI